jgi:queuine tRNA-ribosyltransferase
MSELEQGTGELTQGTGELETAHGALRLPAFLPDGTRGVVRSVDGEDLKRCGVQALVVNTLHLGETPGLGPIRASGGVHRFMGWDRPIVSDSGGFQVHSLLRMPGGLAKVTDEGFSYALRGGRRRRLLSAKRCVTQQLALGSDVAFCLDHCTHPEEPAEVQRESVQRTLRWARSGREALDAELGKRAREGPLLFAVVQGGLHRELRRRCVEGLLEIGFDGFGFGGWPVAEDGRLVEMVAYVAELLPPHVPKHALGIGRPESLVAAARAGYTMFDCTLPTRNARRGVVYLFTGEPLSETGAFYRTLRLDSERLRRDARPLEQGCDCPACTRFSRAYVSHLARIGDGLAARLATQHNLRFYTRLVERLGE